MRELQASEPLEGQTCESCKDLSLQRFSYARVARLVKKYRLARVARI